MTICQNFWSKYATGAGFGVLELAYWTTNLVVSGSLFKKRIPTYDSNLEDMFWCALDIQK